MYKARTSSAVYAILAISKVGVMNFGEHDYVLQVQLAEQVLLQFDSTEGGVVTPVGAVLWIPMGQDSVFKTSTFLGAFGIPVEQLYPAPSPAMEIALEGEQHESNVPF